MYDVIEELTLNNKIVLKQSANSSDPLHHHHDHEISSEDNEIIIPLSGIIIRHLLLG